MGREDALNYDFRRYMGDDAFMPDPEDPATEGILPECPRCGADFYDLAAAPTLQVTETRVYRGVLVGGGEAGGTVVTGFREMGGIFPVLVERSARCTACGAYVGVPGEPVA